MNSNLQCQAAASNKWNLYVYCPIEEDVTLSANWVVADSSIVRMLEPGIFTAVGPGHTFVRATWERLTSPMRPVSVFPGTPPIPTGEITGSVWHAGQVPANSYIDGAVVEILDGLVAGRTATSGVPPPLLPGYLGPLGGKGYYRLLGIPPGTYRLHLTKDGYGSQERGVEVTGSGTRSVDFPLLPN